MNPTKSLLYFNSLLLVTATSHAALVAQWSLEAGTGTTTVDSVSSTAGTLGTGVTWSSDTSGAGSNWSASFPNTTAGHINTALNANDIGIAGTGAKTIVGWFKTSSQEQQMMFGYSPTNGLGAGADLRLGHDSDGFLRFEVSSGFALYNGATVDNGSWNKVAVVIDANDTTDDVQFYLNGSLFNPTSSNGRLIDTAGTETQGAQFDSVLIGNGNPLSATQAWDGLIDEVRVYDSALSLTELNALSAIPEPSTLLFSGLGLLMLLRRRR